MSDFPWVVCIPHKHKKSRELSIKFILTIPFCPVKRLSVKNHLIISKKKGGVNIRGFLTTVSKIKKENIK